MGEHRICVYTCITGDYDDLKNITREEGIDYLCFTNNKNIRSNTWDIIYIEDCSLDNILLARKNKILMNDYIKNNYDICIWIDGAITIRNNLHDFLESQCKLEQFDMTVFNHSARRCVYEEAVKIVEFRKAPFDKVKRTIDFLKSENYPKDNGLTETGILVRKTNSSLVDKTMKLWFELVQKYSTRDQLTFDYSVYRTGIKINRLGLSVYDNMWFVWVRHNAKLSFDTCRIFFYEFNNIDNKNLTDVKKMQDENYLYKTVIKIDCNFIVIYLGQIENAVISHININNKPFVTNCLMIVNGKYLLSGDPLILRVDDKFYAGDKLVISFNLTELNMQDYREMLILKNEEFIQTTIRDQGIIRELNTKINEMNGILSSKKALLKRLIELK